ncbi:MAG: (Fe-S)-binding protein [Alphaproteobacteria bacterium]
MREGSLDAPTRHPVDWQNPDFTDPEKLDAEMRRQLDVCHGCRRCFNLCDSFPRLFDLIDESESEELDTVDSKDFAPVVEACTLCDMCFLTKCPYVPPHEFALDIPHLMLRYRYAEHKAGNTALAHKQLAQTDRNGKLAGMVAPIANWGANVGNTLTRPVMEKVGGIDRQASLPRFNGKTLTARAKKMDHVANSAAPAASIGGRKAAIFATCYTNYNLPEAGEAAIKLLNHLGVETRVDYPGCCGMPYLEHGNIEKVVAQAEMVAAALLPLVDEGYDIVAPTASCALMLKFEWPLLAPDNADLKKLAEATFDVCEYVVDIAKKEGLPEGLNTVDGGVTVHHACHARAQNMGAKSAEMLRLIPKTKVALVERCSGHGGTFGVLKETHAVAVKIARPTVRQIKKAESGAVVSDCPLAANHLHAMMRDEGITSPARHPIEIMAQAYGL